jgi:hypothetical protein
VFEIGHVPRPVWFAFSDSCPNIYYCINRDGWKLHVACLPEQNCTCSSREDSAVKEELRAYPVKLKYTIQSNELYSEF